MAEKTVTQKDARRLRHAVGEVAAAQVRLLSPPTDEVTEASEYVAAVANHDEVVAELLGKLR